MIITWHDLYLLVSGAVLVALWGIFKLILSKNVLERLIVILLKHGAKNSANTLDDELIAVVEQVLDKKNAV